MEIHSQNEGTTSTLSLPVGHWFRTFPLILILSSNGVNLEATALSPRYGFVSDADTNGSMGAPPRRLEFFSGDTTYNLEVCGSAYKIAFLSEAERQAALRDLAFLDIAP